MFISQYKIQFKSRRLFNITIAHLEAIYELKNHSRYNFL